MTFPQTETSFGFIRRQLQAACRRLPKIHAYMKFLLEKRRAAIGIAITIIVIKRCFMLSPRFIGIQHIIGTINAFRCKRIARRRSCSANFRNRLQSSQGRRDMGGVGNILFPPLTDP